MSKKNNATCIICGKKYHLCIACERTNANWKSWRAITDNENCYNIYKILNDYNFKKITKEKAFELLKNIELNDINCYKESVKKTLLDILSLEENVVKETNENINEESVKKTKRKKKKESVENILSEETVGTYSIGLDVAQ